MSICSMLISILSMSVEALEMLSAEVGDELVPQARNLKPDDLMSPLCVICVFKKISLFNIQFCFMSLGSDQTCIV